MTAPTRDAANALILQDLFIYAGPKGSTMPTDTTTALDAAFVALGWVDPDGVTETPQGNVTELKGVTGATLARIKDGDGYEYTCNLLESSKGTSDLRYQNSTLTTATGVNTRVVRSMTALVEQAVVIEEHYTNGSIYRRCIGVANVDLGAAKSVYNAFRSYPATISAVQQSDAELVTVIDDNTAEAAGV